MSVVSFALAVVFIIRLFSTSAFRVPYALVVDREQACVASESCRIFPKDQLLYLTQQRGRAKKSGLRDVETADFIRCWRRSGLIEVYCIC